MLKHFKWVLNGCIQIFRAKNEFNIFFIIFSFNLVVLNLTLQVRMHFTIQQKINRIYAKGRLGHVYLQMQSEPD